MNQPPRLPETPHLLSRISLRIPAPQVAKEQVLPLATALTQTRVPGARTQAWTPLPFSPQRGSALLSATRGSRRGVPAGPRRVAPPRSTPLTSSSWAKRFPKEGAIAVPLPARLTAGRASSSKPRAMKRLEPTRNIREGWKDRLRSCLACRGKETPGSDKRRHGGKNSRQLAAGRRQQAGNKDAQRQARSAESKSGWTLCAMRCAPGRSGSGQLAANSKRQRRRGATAHGRWRMVGGDRESGRSVERAAGRKRKGQSAERKAPLAKGLGAMRHALGANGHWATGGFVEKSNR